MRTLLHHFLLYSAIGTSTLLSAQAPPNDACAAAIPMTCGQAITGSTSTATADLNAINCGTSVQAAGVWYSITGTGQAVTLSTCTDFTYDTRLNVYAGTCGSLICVAGNDDGGNCDVGSTLAFAAEQGVPYYIFVQGYEGATGDFELTATCGPITNDYCQGAVAITCSQSLSGSTTEATTDAVPFCESSVQAPGVWYTFTGVAGPVQLSTCESVNYDSRLNVYTGSCGAFVCVTGNDDTPNVGTCSTVNFNAAADETYFILVQGYDGEVGDFLLEMACPTCLAPTAITASASDVSAFINWQSANVGSTYEIEYGPLGFALGSGTVVNGTVNTAAASATIPDLDPGTEYAFYIHEVCGSEDQSATIGVFTFTTLEAPPASNAQCGGAIGIACGGSVEGDTQEGFFLPGITCGAAYISAPGLWYSFTGNGQTMTLSTCDAADFDTKISVYSGSCGALACVAGGDDAPGCDGNTSTVSFPTNSGTSYYAFVHAYEDQVGTFTLSLSCAPTCSPVAANDDCSGAVLLDVSGIGLCQPTSGNNTCAFAPGTANPPCDPFSPIIDIWYQFESGPFTSFLVYATALSAEGVNIALYRDCGTPEYVECETGLNAVWPLNNLEPESTYYLRMWNGGGPDAGTFAVCVETDLTTSVANVEPGQTVVLWPNPASGRVNISGAHAGRIAIVDLQGRTVMTHRINTTALIELDVHALAPGSYVVRSLDDDGATLGRFIKE
ncbi:MAG: T9SS type A sorting domain-containing protein [Flavobacteriales bacterium]|nr:T9SS type A sorting domain-containing protein [Flavobacteriales bacterium]